MNAFAGIRACFIPEKVNTKRQPELDLAKGLSILFMVWTLTFDELSPNSEGIWVTIVRNILGGPLAAPRLTIC